MTKNMFVVLATLIVLAGGLAFNFDGFKVLATLGFMMALDLYIISIIRYIKIKKLLETLDEESK